MAKRASLLNYISQLDISKQQTDFIEFYKKKATVSDTWKEFARLYMDYRAEHVNEGIRDAIEKNPNIYTDVNLKMLVSERLHRIDEYAICADLLGGLWTDKDYEVEFIKSRKGIWNYSEESIISFRHLIEDLKRKFPSE